MVKTADGLALSSLLIAPTEEEWRAMSPTAREALLVRILDALSDPAAAMSEGRRHKKAKTSALDALGLHFGAIGRTMYLAEEMAVLYPGETVFTPDVLAVVGVAEPDDDARMAWVVADEGKGLDLVIEVLHHGSRNKDLVDNVERYASLGIPEYFVYDRLHQRILGYRLPDAAARRYQRIVPQGGRHASAVLGLELAIEGGKLRFFYGMAELPGTSDLIGRLNRMVTALEARADAAEARVEGIVEQIDAMAAEAEAAHAQADAAHAQAQAAQAQAEAAQAQSAQALAALRQGIAALLGARGLACSEADRTRLASCTDVSTLQRWLLRATSAGAAEEVFSS
jgi:Uma2 family endonuclease